MAISLFAVYKDFRLACTSVSELKKKKIKKKSEWFQTV